MALLLLKWLESEWMKILDENQIKKLKKVDAITYIPLPLQRKWQRGFDFSLLIAKWFSQIIAKPYFCFLVNRKYTVALSRTKSKEERTRIVRDRFGVWKKQSECLKQCENILLVDDIVTTGATMNAAAFQLKEAHPSVSILFLALAFTPSLSAGSQKKIVL